MATITQKDVLIDAVADAKGLIARIKRIAPQDVIDATQSDRAEILRLSAFLYRTEETDINYREVLAQIKTVLERWQPIEIKLLAETKFLN